MKTIIKKDNETLEKLGHTFHVTCKKCKGTGEDRNGNQCDYCEGAGNILPEDE